MQAMHGRLSDPVTYQALQHFITHSPWEAERVWSRCARMVPGAQRDPRPRRHRPAEAGHALGRRQAAVLRGPRQDRQLPGRGVDRVDRRRSDVAADLRAVRAERVDRGSPSAARGGHSRHGALPREVADRARADSSRAEGGLRAHGGRRRRGLRPRRGVSARARAAGPALRASAMPWSLAVWTAGAHRARRPAGEVAARIPERAWQRVCWGHGHERPLWPLGLSRAASGPRRAAATAGCCASARWPTTNGSTTC